MLQSRVVLSNGYLFKNMVVITIWPLLRYLRIPTNHIGCVMVSVLIASVVDRGFERRSGPSKDYTIRLFRIISIPSNFRLPNHVILMEC